MGDTQTWHLVESQSVELPLDPKTQQQLRAVGRRLAKGTGRYGEPLDRDASLIAVEGTGSDRARVRVRDAVGLIALPGHEFHVKPKIPQGHLLALLQASQLLPRLDTGRGNLDERDDLVELIANWFVLATEKVLEYGLASDYHELHGELAAVRGRLSPADTARLFYKGRLAVVSDYEEFDLDTPLNRTLLGATRAIAAGTPLPLTLRARALRIAARMDGVGELRPGDLAETPDRRTDYYTEAIQLARNVLQATGRTLDLGASAAWTFLIRTPAAVEAGVRAALAQALAPLTVEKRSVRLEGSPMTVNPDLVFDGGTHVADVKYKVGGDDWNRGDLYEVVAFAAATRTDHAAIIRFRSDLQPSLPTIQIGDFRVRDIIWRALPGFSHEQALEVVADEVRAWLRSGEGN